jgi:hypothetical protein
LWTNPLAALPASVFDFLICGHSRVLRESAGIARWIRRARRNLPRSFTGGLDATNHVFMGWFLMCYDNPVRTGVVLPINDVAVVQQGFAQFFARGVVGDADAFVVGQVDPGGQVEVVVVGHGHALVGVGGQVADAVVGVLGRGGRAGKVAPAICPGSTAASQIGDFLQAVF